MLNTLKAIKDRLSTVESAVNVTPVDAVTKRVVYPSGFIILWGSCLSTLDTPESFTFNTPFPHDCYFINCDMMGGQTSFTSVTKDGFTFDRTSGYAGSVTMHYMAFGW